MNFSLLARKAGRRSRLVFGFGSLMEAQAVGMRYLREGQGWSVQIHNGTSPVWSRGQPAPFVKKFWSNQKNW